jgi:hypothetical protein
MNAGSVGLSISGRASDHSRAQEDGYHENIEAAWFQRANLLEDQRRLEFYEKPLRVNQVKCGAWDALRRATSALNSISSPAVRRVRAIELAEECRWVTAARAASEAAWLSPLPMMHVYRTIANEPPDVDGACSRASSGCSRHLRRI